MVVEVINEIINKLSDVSNKLSKVGADFFEFIAKIKFRWITVWMN